MFNLPPDHPEWLHWQRYYLDHPENYPASGDCPVESAGVAGENCELFSGIFHLWDEQNYTLSVTEPVQMQGEWTLVTLRSLIDKQLQTYPHQQPLTVRGRLNHAGKWLLVENIIPIHNSYFDNE